jgi:nucleoid DNA-binding protein
LPKTSYRNQRIEAIKLNRSELLKQIRIRARITNVESEAFLKAFIETVYHELQENGEIKILNFGKFRKVVLKPRTIKVPGSKTEKKIGARNIVRFVPFSFLKEVI